MTVSGSNMGFSLLRMVAENAVESSESNRLATRAIRRGAEDAAKNAVAMQKLAHNKAGVQSTVNIATQAVSTVQSIGNVKSAAESASAQATTRDQLNTARTSGSNEAGGMDAIMEVDLGNGRTVGDRFSREQVEVLMNGDFTKDQLIEAGFTEREATDLMFRENVMGGVDQDDAVNWMVENSATEQEKDQAHVKEKVQDLVKKAVMDTFSQAMEGTQENSREEAGRAKKDGRKRRSIGEELAQSTLDHNQAIGETMIELIRGREDLSRR